MIDTNTLTGPARRIQHVMTGGIVLFAVGLLVMIGGAFTWPTLISQWLADVSGFDTGPLQTWQMAGLTAITTVHVLVWIVLLMLTRQVFAHLADGKPDLSAHHAQKLAYWLWAMLIWGLISQVLVSVVATWGFPEGEREIALAIGTGQVSIALAALIAGVMARAFALGAELWQDHRQVV